MGYLDMNPPNDEPTYKEETLTVQVDFKLTYLNDRQNTSLLFLGDTEIDDFKTLDELKQAINQLIIENL